MLPVSEKSRDYAHKVAEQIEAAGIRVTVDNRDEKIGYKIREARSIDRVPYMLILGEKEAAEGNISVRDRSNETVPSTVEDFCAKVKEGIRTRAEPAKPRLNFLKISRKAVPVLCGFYIYAIMLNGAVGYSYRANVQGA